MHGSILALLDGLGGPELFVIAVVTLLLFGSKRMPEIGRGIGRAIREFKRATSGVEENIREVLYDEPARPKLRPPAQRGPARSTPSGTATTSPLSPAADAPVSASPATPRANADLNEPAPPETPDFADEASRPDDTTPRRDEPPTRV